MFLFFLWINYLFIHFNENLHSCRILMQESLFLFEMITNPKKRRKTVSKRRSKVRGERLPLAPLCVSDAFSFTCQVAVRNSTKFSVSATQRRKNLKSEEDGRMQKICKQEREAAALRKRKKYTIRKKKVYDREVRKCLFICFPIKSCLRNNPSNQQIEKGILREKKGYGAPFPSASAIAHNTFYINSWLVGE